MKRSGEATSEPPKVARTCSALYIFTSKRASRHNGVHFFDISTSKSGPRPPVFNTFDFEMCFAPQRLALFRHLNFQKWSEPLSVLYILTSKCASRHNGVHFFDILTSKSGPTMMCFEHFDFKMCFAPQRRAIFHLSCGQLAAGSAPAALASLLFDPPEPQIIGKTQCFATFLPFRASASSVFLLFLFLLSSNLSLLYASSLLCFSSLHIVGSLTSKLPSIV